MRQPVAPPRLSPPPQLVPPDRPPPARGARRHGAATWVTAALFAVLGVAAAAVFVVLPEWVAARHAAEPTATGPAATGPAAPEVVAADRDGPIRSVESPAIARAPADGGEPVDAAPGSAPRVALPTAAEPEARRPGARPAPAAGTPRAEPASRSAEGSDAAFQQAMSAGLSALEAGDYPAAREAFSRAAGLRPGSRASADGLARAEVGLRLAELTRLRAEAEAFEIAEKWRQAAELYGRALALDPTVEFAQRGLERSRARAELGERLESFLAHPGRLGSDEVLEEASATHARGAAIDPAGPELQRQVAGLGELVRAYSTPVRAVVVSDGMTEVTIYRVGRLGTFERRVFELRPGTYTVIGSRRGFRDVRRQLVIEPGVEPEPLEVRCREEV